MKNTVTTITCDLCGADETEVKGQLFAKGWMDVDCESTREDRLFFTKNICPKCVKQIVDKEKK